MKQLSFQVLILVLAAGAAQADCYADYKAKQDNPLRLHYGVAEIRGNCNIGTAEDQLRPALQRDGWQLLTVLGVFDEGGLDERRNSAGDYFLRY
ncbi:hypothetical protein ACJ5NV_15730 [Loktanella agnita]|uniref:hypothetical protein n=1 Tax=Loktanella agnita TaxID=287097 RepID=UPI00398A1140